MYIQGLILSVLSGVALAAPSALLSPRAPGWSLTNLTKGRLMCRRKDLTKTHL